MRCEVIAPIGARPARPVCQGCGCTDDHACPGGCSWVSLNPPLCSSCDSYMAEMEEAGQQASLEREGFFGEERCPASQTPALHAMIWVDGVSGYCARCRQGFTT